VTILAAVLALAAVLFPLAGVLTARHRVAAAADAGALAAADVAVGILPGYPCDAADRVSRANGAALGACKVDGYVFTVQLNVSVLGFVVTASATAGPPASPAG